VAEQQAVSEQLARILRANLTSETEWPAEKIEEGIRLAGQLILTAVRTVPTLKMRHGDRATILLLEVLEESITFNDLALRCVGLGFQNKHKGSQAVIFVRALLFALDGDHTVRSPLDEVDEPSPPSSGAADYSYGKYPRD
jgi:hypothetical protein